MDCAGVCLNGFNSGTYGATIGTYYLDSDDDGWGSTTAGSKCSAGAEAYNLLDPKYTTNNIDRDDDFACASNLIDCAGVCDGTAVLDHCGNCSAAGSGTYSADNNGYTVYNLANVKYGITNGVILTDYGGGANYGRHCESCD